MSMFCLLHKANLQKHFRGHFTYITKTHIYSLITHSISPCVNEVCLLLEKYSILVFLPPNQHGGDTGTFSKTLTAHDNLFYFC